MYKLYGKKGSGSASIEAALEIVGAPYRFVETASWEKNDAFRDLLAVNPIGQIPTLVLDDGTGMSESAAILIHLDQTYPESRLLPAEPSLRAQSMRGLVFIAANCYPAITIGDFPERFCDDLDEAITKRIRSATRKWLYRHWEIFADLFPARPFLNGDKVGALDLYAAVVSRWSGARRHLEQHRPLLSAAFTRIESDPSVAAVFRRHWPAT